jgi:catechol 2,3-dioxygenase-like lactoylglutathione lyase family enzyme
LAYEFNHVHLKAPDPEATANWYVKVFGFRILSDTVREFGDRFLQCESPDGVRFNISGARTGETLGDGDARAHYGIEHVGINVPDLDAEIERLKGHGAELMEGPIQTTGGPKIAFIKAPNDVRIEILQLP